MSITDQQFLDWDRADATQRVLLMEASPYVGAAGSGTITTRYLSNRWYVTGPAETPANTAYDDRITATPAFTVRMSELLLGRSTPSWGDIEIFNGDHAIDSWLDDGWEGCAINLFLGDATWPRSDFRQVATLTCAGITARNSGILAIQMRDFQLAFDIPLTSEVMGVGPNANALRPVTYGFCRNITPILENSSTLKYRVNAFEVNLIDQVRDNGVPVAFTQDLADGSFTLSSTPAGTVTCDVSSGGRSFGSMWCVVADATAAGQQLQVTSVSGSTTMSAGAGTFSSAAHSFTAAAGTPFAGGPAFVRFANASNKQNNGAMKVRSVIGGGTGVVVEAALVDETATGIDAYGTFVLSVGFSTHKSLWAGYLMRRIIERHTTLAPAQLGISYYDLPAQVAYYTANGATVSDALDKMATAALGFYSFDSNGVIYCGMVKSPETLTASASLTEDDVALQTMRIVRDVSAQSGVMLLLEKNWTQQTAFAGSVSDADRTKFSSDHYSFDITSAGNSSKYPIATPWTSATDDVLAYEQYSSSAIETGLYAYDTHIRDQIISIFGVHRHVYAFETKSAPYTLRLGEAINLTHPNFGFSGGANALIVGIVKDFVAGTTTLEVLK